MRSLSKQLFFKKSNRLKTVKRKNTTKQDKTDKQNKAERVHGLYYVLVNSTCAGVLAWSMVGMHTTMLIRVIKVIRVLSVFWPLTNKMVKPQCCWCQRSGVQHFCKKHKNQSYTNAHLAS